MKTKTMMAACAATAVGFGLAAAAPWTADAHPARAAITVSLEDAISGDWEGTLTIETPQGSFDLDLAMSLELDGTDVTGTFTITGPDGNSQDVDFEGEYSEDDGSVTGVLTNPDEEGEAQVEMEVDGDEMTGSIHVEEGGVELDMELSVSRVD